MAHNVAGSWARRRGKVVESEQQQMHTCQIRQAQKAQWEDEALEGNGDCGFRAVGAQLAQLHGKSLEAAAQGDGIRSKMQTYLQKHKK